MAKTYQHTLRYSEIANARPTFQSYLDVVGADSNLNRTSKRYYSSADVSIYFGDFFIDDACHIDFEVTESAMLLYGYNSYVFDDILKGARMVQGRFAINFTQANYLSKVLSDISVYKGTGAITHSRYHALWPTGFDLLVHHGSKELSNASANDLQLIMLQDIYITGCSTQSNPKTGEPITEIYTFIGRDVKFGAELDAPTDTEQEPIFEEEATEEVKLPDSVKISFVKYSSDILVNFNQAVKIESFSYYLGEENAIYRPIKIDSNSDITQVTISVSKTEANKWKNGYVTVNLKIKYKDSPGAQEYSQILAVI